jgi:hypothetical protein
MLDERAVTPAGNPARTLRGEETTRLFLARLVAEDRLSHYIRRRSEHEQATGVFRPPESTGANMATEKQMAANRRNGGKSTGPRTAEGKARARLNALTWGLSQLNGVGLLPTESRWEYDAFREEHLTVFNPVGIMEEQLMTEIVDCNWGLRRAAKIKIAVLAHGVADADVRYLTEAKRMVEITRATAVRRAAGIGDAEDVVRIVDKEWHERLQALIDKALATKQTDVARLGAGFIESADSLALLARYTTAILRHRTQVLADLTALQAARLSRGGEPDPA